MNAIEYVDYVMKKACKGQDKAWQAFMLGAIRSNMEELFSQTEIDRKRFYDKMYIPFYDACGHERPPHSRRGNFIGGRLGNLFNRDGPFANIDKGTCTLREGFRDEAVWIRFDGWWKEFERQGTTRSRALKREEAALRQLESHVATLKFEGDMRAEDAGADGRAMFRGKWVPRQVKGFLCDVDIINQYVKHERLYQQTGRGCLVMDDITQQAIDYIRNLTPMFHIRLERVSTLDILTGKEDTSVLFFWERKSTQHTEKINDKKNDKKEFLNF